MDGSYVAWVFDSFEKGIKQLILCIAAAALLVGGGIGFAAHYLLP